jgi:hypothetical protein
VKVTSYLIVAWFAGALSGSDAAEVSEKQVAAVNGVRLHATVSRLKWLLAVQR